MSTETNTAKPEEKSHPGPIFAFISREGLQKLLEYKYVSGQYSVGDKLMTPFWEWFVTLMPLVSSLSPPLTILKLLLIMTDGWFL